MDRWQNNTNTITITVTLTPTVPTERGHSTARAIRDIQEMAPPVLVNSNSRFQTYVLSRAIHIKHSVFGESLDSMIFFYHFMIE